MSKTNLVQDRIAKILQEQNSELDVKFRVSKQSDEDVKVDIKTPNVFLQLNNLGEILDNTFYKRIIFDIEHKTTLNIQSKRYEYAINASEDCTMHSFFLMAEGNVYVQLGPNCKLYYKGQHNIKTNIGCTIENANR